MASFKRFSFSREGYLGVKSVFYPPENINAYDFKKYFLAVLAEIPTIEILQEEIVSEVVTLEEKITALENSLRLRVESSFSELVSGAKNKIDVIISFLAILEMVKQRIVQVEQQELFDEIKLKLCVVS
jgi:segregation and condensation protein A